MTPERERRSRRAREVRALSLNMGRMPKQVIDLGRRLFPEAHDRPRTRAECVNGPRPCPYAGCKFNLYLDVSTKGRSIKLNFPDLAPGEMAESCALDVADRGGATHEQVGAMMNITREGVRLIEVEAKGKLATALLKFAGGGR